MSLPGANSSDSTSVREGGAEPLELSPGVRAADGFELIGISCLRQIAANEPRLRRNEDEALHRLRVGLRRLRAALSLFKKLLRDPQSAAIQGELRWMTQKLGPARDYQVFLDDVRALRADAARGDAGLEQLETLLSELHARALARARRHIDDERYRHGIEHVTRWLVSGDWATNSDRRQRRRRRQSLRRLARKVLKRRAKKLIAKLGRVERLNARRRHRLRIAVKKLRYGVEFFAGLFPDAVRERKRFNKHLKALQDALGRLNDISVHQRLAPELLHHAKRRRTEPAMSALSILASREAAELSLLTRAAAHRRERLANDAPFWA